MAFAIDAGVQDEIDGIDEASQIKAPVNARPNRITDRLASGPHTTMVNIVDIFSATVVDTADNACGDP